MFTLLDWLKKTYENKQILLAAALALTAISVQADCLTDTRITELVANISVRTPAATPQGLSEADGVCSREKLHLLLEKSYGRVIGYKANLTNPAVQKRFNYNQSAWGKLCQGMVLLDGAIVEAGFGARPLFEADMLVRVRSDAINQAKTQMDVFLAVDQIISFIELPDLVVQARRQLSGPAVSAINLGARALQHVFYLKYLP